MSSGLTRLTLCICLLIFLYCYLLRFIIQAMVYQATAVLSATQSHNPLFAAFSSSLLLVAIWNHDVTYVWSNSHHCTPHRKIWTQLIDLTLNVWLHSSVGRASHQYRRGHGFESCWSPDFFQTSSFQLLKLENLLRWFFTLIYSHIDFSHFSLK